MTLDAIADDMRAKLPARIGRGCGIVLAIDDPEGTRIVGVGTSGRADLPIERAAFEIGSITKLFTSTLFATMIARGEIAEDATLGSRIADLPPEIASITLAQLAEHRSGLPPLPPNLTTATASDPYRTYDATMLLAGLRATKLATPPGTAFAYSNFGGGLLGYVLAQRLGMSYADALRKRVFTPLGMSATDVATPGSTRADLATPHDDVMLPSSPWTFDALAGAGAIRSTAADMVRFARAARGVGPSDLTRAIAFAQTPRAAGSGGGIASVGLGWLTSAYGVRWHNGGTGGFRSDLFYDPKRDRVAVAMINRISDLDDVLARVITGTTPLGPAAPDRFALTDAERARLVGRYGFAPGVELAVAAEGEALFVQLTGQGRIGAMPTAPTELRIPVVGAVIDAELPADGGPARAIVLQQNGTTQRAARL